MNLLIYYMLDLFANYFHDNIYFLCHFDCENYLSSSRTRASTTIPCKCNNQRTLTKLATAVNNDKVFYEDYLGLWSWWKWRCHEEQTPFWMLASPSLGSTGFSLHLSVCWKLLHASAVVAQDFALLTQMLGVLLALVRHVQPVWLL